MLTYELTVELLGEDEEVDAKEEQEAHNVLAVVLNVVANRLDESTKPGR